MSGVRRMAAVAAVAVALAVAGCTGEQQPPPRPGTSSTAAPASCTGSVTTGPLPEWARAGFTPPDQPAPYVLGANGDILGVLFGLPLTAPPRPDLSNKILWVSRVDVTSGSLKIRARLAGSGLSVEREVEGGPGPSIIDMPRAGCWSFSLSWSGHHDRLSVRYVPRQ